MLQNPAMCVMWGFPATFSLLEASEVKFPALEGFVLPTYFPSRLGNLTRSHPMTRADSDAQYPDDFNSDNFWSDPAKST